MKKKDWARLMLVGLGIHTVIKAIGTLTVAMSSPGMGRESYITTLSMSGFFTLAIGLLLLVFNPDLVPEKVL